MGTFFSFLQKKKILSKNGQYFPTEKKKLREKKKNAASLLASKTDSHWTGIGWPYITETMHSALNLYCTMRAQLISATRGRASQPKVLVMATDCSATCQQG